MKRHIYAIVLLLVCLVFSNVTQAQSSRFAKKNYPDFLALRKQADTSWVLADSAVGLGAKIFTAETEKENKRPDTTFLAELCKTMGELGQLSYDYETATLYHLLAGIYYQNIGNELEAGKTISKYLLTYEVIRLKRQKTNVWKAVDSTIFNHGKGDTVLWMTADARDLRWSPNGDTVFVVLNAGRAQNMIEGSKFDVFTTFDTFSNYNRRSIQAGTGFITHIDEFTSQGYMVFFDDFEDTIYHKDAFEIKIATDKRYYSGQLSQLGAYNIKFTNHASEVYFVGGDGNLTIDGGKFEIPIKKAMIQSFRDAISYYDSISPGVLDIKIETGRFGGMNYRDMFASATLFDLENFLDYIITYPAKYINQEYNLASRFATWVINDCYLGNNESRVLDSIFMLNKQQIMAKSQVWGEYYKQLTKADSVYLARVVNVYELQPEQRIYELEKLKELSRFSGNASSDSFYTVNLIYQHYGRKNQLAALSYADEIWPRLKGWDKQLIALYKGVLFSGLNRSEEAIRFLDSSLAIDSTYYYAKGYKGWNLIKLGKIKQAFPYCKSAWEVDSFATWTNINYGHALFLRGDKAQARRLYRKSFEFMTVPSDYCEGLETDFDYFINAGLNENDFKELKVEFSKYYKENWEHLIAGDSLKKRGENLEGKDQYDEALRLMSLATKEYFKDAKPDWERIRGAYRWSGYIHYRKKDYRNSVVFYKQAGALTVAQGLGDDNLITDYTDVANVYDWLDDTLREMEYRSRSSSLEVALREKRDPKRLYMLVVGPGYTKHNDTFSYQDALAVSTALNGSADLYFDSVTNKTYLGSNATLANIQNALDTAIYTLGENDVFVFYYSGYGATGENEGIQLADKLFSVRDLSGYLSQVPAGRQIHIADCNGLNWREWYQRGNFSQFSSEKRSLMFLGLKTARIEEPGLSHAVLTDALLKGLNQSLADGSATATEWLSNTVSGLYFTDRLYAVEMQTYGHDFVLGRAKVKLQVADTFPPVIELFGAVATRGENISVVNTRAVISGRIFDDNKIVFAQANGIDILISQNGRFELPKELYNVKNVTIVAKDEFGNSSRQNYMLTAAEIAKTTESMRYAYLFASTEYTYWDDLSNPIFDAKKIGELLENYFGYQVKIIENPKRHEVTEKLDQIRRFKFKPNDQLLVFFAGHGLYDTAWGGYYVCPDSKKPENDPFYDTYFKQQQIADLLDGCGAGNVFLVMDVCFGGKMFDKVDRHEYRSVNDGNEMTADEYIKRQMEIKCRQFLTSGGNNYVEDGVAGSHSPFAGRFIIALEDAATGKDYVSASEVMDYLRTMKTLGNDKKSFPRYGFFGGDKDGEYVLKVVRKMRNSATIAGL